MRRKCHAAEKEPLEEGRKERSLVDGCAYECILHAPMHREFLPGSQWGYIAVAYARTWYVQESKEQLLEPTRQRSVENKEEDEALLSF